MCQNAIDVDTHAESILSECVRRNRCLMKWANTRDGFFLCICVVKLPIALNFRLIKNIYATELLP